MARATAYNFTTADIISIDIDTEHRGTVKMVRGDGITIDDASAYSVAPGKAPAPLGTGIGSLSRQIVADQDDLNVRTGLAFAKENSLHDGLFVPRGVPLELPDGYDVFDFALGDWVTLTLAASTNGRGRAYTTATRWYIEGVSVAYDHEAGAKDITLTISHETAGADGVTDPPPFSDLDTFSDWSLDWAGLDSIAIEAEAGLGDLNRRIGNLAVFGQDGDLYTCVWGVNPTWQQETMNGATLSINADHWYSIAVDAYSPLYLGSGTVVNAKAVSDDKIWDIYDIFGVDTGPTATLEHTFAEPTVISHETTRIATERGFQDWWVVAAWSHQSGDPLDAAWIYETYDGGSSWSSLQLNTLARSLSIESLNQAVYASRNVLGKIYTFALNVNVTGRFGIRWRPSQAGSWAWKFSPNTLYTTLPMTGWIEMPVDNNADEEYFYWGSDEGAGENKIYRYDHGVVTDITPVIGGAKYGPRTRRGISSFAGDRNRLAMIATDGDPHADENWVLVTSLDGGSNWTVKQGPTTLATEFPYDGLYISGDDGNTLYLIGSTTSVNTPQIGYSTDFGVTVEDRSNNLAALGCGRIIGIMGG